MHLTVIFCLALWASTTMAEQQLDPAVPCTAMQIYDNHVPIHIHPAVISDGFQHTHKDGTLWKVNYTITYDRITFSAQVFCGKCWAGAVGRAKGYTHTFKQQSVGIKANKTRG